MLFTSAYNDVTIFKIGRSIGGMVPCYTHAFLIGDTLIDTGTRYAGDELLTSLSKNNISKIINTHYHEDHIGNNAELQKKYGSKIFAHPESIPYIKKPRAIGLRLYQRIVWGSPKSSIPIAIGDSIQAGGYTFSVITVAGHSVGHICLFEETEGWLFTGDMFCGIKNIYLRKDENFNQLLASLERLSELKVSTIFCSLKGVIGNGGEAIRAKITFMKDMRDRTRELYREGIHPKSIKHRLLGKEDEMFYITTGHFSKQNLINGMLETTPPHPTKDRNSGSKP